MKFDKDSIGHSISTEAKKLIVYGGEYSVKLTFTYKLEEKIKRKTVVTEGNGEAYIKTNSITSEHIFSVESGLIK